MTSSALHSLKLFEMFPYERLFVSDAYINVTVFIVPWALYGSM